MHEASQHAGALSACRLPPFVFMQMAEVLEWERLLLQSREVGS